MRKTDGSIDHVVTGPANLGKVKTSGVDLSLDYRFPASRYGSGLDLQGTYVSRYDFQQQIGGQYLDNVGDFQGVGVIARWKHRRQRHLEPRRLAGHPEQPLHQRLQRLRPRQPRQGRLVEPLGPGRQLPPQPRAGADPRVKNLFDREPPFSNQTYTFQSGRPALHRSLRAHPVRPPQLQLLMPGGPAGGRQACRRLSSYQIR